MLCELSRFTVIPKGSYQLTLLTSRPDAKVAKKTFLTTKYLARPLAVSNFYIISRPFAALSQGAKPQRDSSCA
jgi:hypothetical protein